MLYPQIWQMQPAIAGKITGMLLELDNSELLDLIGTPAHLQVKVDEAVKALDAFKAANSQ